MSSRARTFESAEHGSRRIAEAERGLAERERFWVLTRSGNQRSLGLQGDPVIGKAISEFMRGKRALGAHFGRMGIVGPAA